MYEVAIVNLKTLFINSYFLISSSFKHNLVTINEKQILH